ncbi:MAG: hypothetical protein E7Z83_02165 [Methanobrevibacter sp.]|nr:hypothetical protein [Methanobrevibacter sp.]MBE6489643.1 hypothetical protein [Methanobrevibacter sp.]
MVEKFSYEELLEQLNNRTDEIDSLKKQLAVKQKNFDNKELDLNHQLILSNNQIKENIVQLNSKDLIIQDKDMQIKAKELELYEIGNNIVSLKKKYYSLFSKLESYKYCNDLLSEIISEKKLEIQYFKSNVILKKILNPFVPVCLILKSKPKEIRLNFKIYKNLKDNDCFDIGYYLKNFPKVQESKLCKYFSPELHYVCVGFDNGLDFNKKYFDNSSKKNLLNNINECE